MGMLDHWHPIYPGHKLKRNPVEIKLCGAAICLYRTSMGTTAALNNVCPHRRLKLSYGRVVGDRLECRYHGWKFDGCGEGESPSTPRLNTCTESYETREEYGYVWLKVRGAVASFPQFDTAGFRAIGMFRHTVPAPLELTLDNFTEIEHSGTVHDTFGYDLDRLHEVKVSFEPTEDSVRVVNVGPTKRINRFFRWVLGIGRDYHFHDDWTTFFSPVYTVFDHWWTNPENTREAMVRWRIYMFFNPVDADRTDVVSFAYAKSRYPIPGGGLRTAKYVFRRQIDREIRQDISMLEHLGDKRVCIDGMKLSRFDKVLGLTRERIARIYRGETGRSDGGRVALVG